MPNTSPVQLPTGTAPTGLRRSTGRAPATFLDADACSCSGLSCSRSRRCSSASRRPASG
ncbi:hypothetical protein ACFPRL_21225 [Pseudoclavibacter helvolus]